MCNLFVSASSTFQWLVVEARRITDGIVTDDSSLFESQRNLIHSLNSFGYEDGAQVG